MKHYLFLIALIIISLSACKKDKDKYGPGTQPQPQQLPPITTEGKNTFGCLVNGEVWLPEVKPSQMFVYPLTSSYDNIGFRIDARKRIENLVFQKISMQIINLNDIGIYYLNSNSSIGSSGSFFNSLIDCLYITDTLQIGKVEILKLDIPNKIISGTFEMNFYKSDIWGNPDCDTIYITDGRFDVKFAQ